MQDAVSTLLFLLLRERGGSRIPRHLQAVRQLNRKEGLLIPPLPGTNLATFTAVHSRISQPLWAALNEKWKFSLNPWRLFFFGAILSFEEIVPVKVGVGIKFSMVMSAYFGIQEFEKFCLFGLKYPISGTFRSPIFVCNPFMSFIRMSPFSPLPSDFP
jgi:hypothetical protein